MCCSISFKPLWGVGKGLVYKRSNEKEYAKAGLETRMFLFF